MKSRKSFSSILGTIVIIASLSGAAFAQKKYIGASEFGQKLGRAKKDHHLEVNVYAGAFGFKHVGYSIAYGYVYNDGLGEVNIPFSYQPFGQPPTPANGTMVYFNPSNVVIGSGLKIRKFKNEIDEGLFYGGGLRIWHIITKYERLKNKIPTAYEFSYQNWSPLTEIGYTQKFSTTIGANYSIELGGSFSTYDDLTENINTDTAEDVPGDPGHTPAFDYTGVYYALNMGIFYSF